ncbi:MAG TPA: low-specificity L-threonine aldolase [bacterium]
MNRDEVIDLRSDTVTQPTEAMREAMARSAVGDDVFGEDPTVKDLEVLAAERLGKEAGLFVPSGTMANLVALLTHTQRGDEAIVEAESHTYNYESGAMAAVAGVLPRPVLGTLGYISPEQIRSAVHPADPHYAPVRLVCLENTHNRHGGIPFGPEEMDAACLAAHDLGLSVHVDGARIFNAAVALGVPAASLARHADSVMFCVSKGLSAPVGSVLLGDREFIARALRFRKMVGGGMRQAGVIAAAGIVALQTMVDRLAEDHANARRLATGIAQVPGLIIRPELVRTNILYFSVSPPLPVAEFLAGLKRQGVLALSVGSQSVRMVTHRHITGGDVDGALAAIRQAASVLTPS